MTVWKEPTDVATTEALGAGPAFPASGVIDGVTLKVGHRVLVKDQLTSTENGYYDVAGVPAALTLTATGESIEAEDVIRVSQGDRNAHTAWALDDATNRIFVRQDVKHYSLTSIDALKHLWQVLPGATATVAGYYVPGDKGGGDFTFLSVQDSARVVSVEPLDIAISNVTNVNRLVKIKATGHGLGDFDNVTRAYIKGLNGLSDGAYYVKVGVMEEKLDPVTGEVMLVPDPNTLTLCGYFTGVSLGVNARIQYVKVVTAAEHKRATGQRVAVTGVKEFGGAPRINGTINDGCGVIDKKSLSIPITHGGGTYAVKKNALIGDDALMVPASNTHKEEDREVFDGDFGGLWQRLRTDHFDVRWFGAKPNWDGTKGTDNLAAFNACLAAMAADGNLGGKLVARGAFYLSNTLDLVHTIIFEGDGANEPNFGTGARSAPGTWLVFPKNVTGIRVHSAALYDNPASSAENSVFRNLTIFCKERDATGHGIWSSTTIHCENVNVQGFAEHGFFVSASFVKSGDGNANGSYFEHCTAGDNGLDGFHIEGGDAQACLVMRCKATVNGRWGFYDEAVSNMYLMCLGEANFGETGKAYGGDYKAVGNNISSFIGCYTEANPNLNQLTGQETIIGGGLSAAQALPVNSRTFAIGPNGVMGNGPLQFANTSGPDATLIEFGSPPTGVDGVVLNFSTPALVDYNFLRWDSLTGWWGIHNTSPNDRTSIQFPTTRTAPRRVAPLFKNGIFFGSASTLNDDGTSKALVNHTAASVTPLVGTWEKGDVVWNTEATPGGNVGWVCTTAGTNGKLPAGLTTGSIAKEPKKDTEVTVSALTDLVPWQYIMIGDGKDAHQIVKVNLPTIDIAAPGARATAPSGAAIAGGMVVGVVTARPVSVGDTIVTLNKLDGLVLGQNITIVNSENKLDTYEIVKITPPTIDIAAPGVLGGAPLKAAIKFSEATFATFGTIEGTGQSALDLSGGDHTLTPAEAAAPIIVATNSTVAVAITLPTPSDDAHAYQRTFRNLLTGAGTLTVKLAAGASVSIAVGKTAIVGFDASGAYRVTADV